MDFCGFLGCSKTKEDVKQKCGEYRVRARNTSRQIAPRIDAGGARKADFQNPASLRTPDGHEIESKLGISMSQMSEFRLCGFVLFSLSLSQVKLSVSISGLFPPLVCLKAFAN